MADLRRPIRLVLTLAVVVLGLFELQNLLEILLSQSRLRERAVRSAQDAARACEPQVSALLAAGGSDAWNAALQAALRSTSAAEAELFTFGGQRVAAQPRAAPVEHWLRADDVEALRGGARVTAGPLPDGGGRLLTYAAVRSGGQELVLRLATAASDLIEDLHERRQLLVGHVVAMVLLAVVAILASFPGRPAPVSAPHAIDAYVEAMERLRDHGEALTQRHEALEDALEDREAMARAGELTAGMVHEVRNGLGTIVGYARLVEGSGASPAAIDAAGRIREECETLERVVRRFMDFVKREKLTLGPLDLGRMLTRVVARETRGRPGGDVVIEDVGDVGLLTGDEDLLERAFENLVRNAREAAGEQGHVWVRATREGDDSVVVAISDDGPGIPAATRQGLRPFFTTKAGGLGLGLPIALKIIRLHQGDMTLSDRPPRGLAVTVRLPTTGPDRGVTGSSAAEGSAGAADPGAGDLNN